MQAEKSNESFTIGKLDQFDSGLGTVGQVELKVVLDLPELYTLPRNLSRVSVAVYSIVPMLTLT